LFLSTFPFADALTRAESLHVHIKVDVVSELRLDEIASTGGRLEYQKEGFVKFCFPDGLNVIFSSIPVSQDELIEGPVARRGRPFVDHFGIDLREENDEVKRVFDAIPCTAKKLGWGHVAQGESGQGVHCCHVEVQAKHWVYPLSENGAPPIPLEFAYGQLKINDQSGGCDLRPMDPAQQGAAENVTCDRQRGESR